MNPDTAAACCASLRRDVRDEGGRPAARGRAAKPQSRKDRYVGLHRGRPAHFDRNRARPAASRAERTTVREHGRRRDREGIDRKASAF
jgi:hypothetical protein